MDSPEIDIKEEPINSDSEEENSIKDMHTFVYVKDEPFSDISTTIQNEMDPLDETAPVHPYKKSKPTVGAPIKTKIPTQFKVTRTYSNQRKNLLRVKVQYVCDKCKLILSSAQLLESHKMRVHGDGPSHKILNSITVPKKKDDNIATMDQCSRNQKAGRYFMLAQRKNYSCDVCYSEYDLEEELDTHRKEFHVVPNAYACHLCDEKFDSQEAAQTHLVSEHSEARFRR